MSGATGRSKKTVVSLFVDEPQRFGPAAYTNGMGFGKIPRTRPRREGGVAILDRFGQCILVNTDGATMAPSAMVTMQSSASWGCDDQSVPWRLIGRMGRRGRRRRTLGISDLNHHGGNGLEYNLQVQP